LDFNVGEDPDEIAMYSGDAANGDAANGDEEAGDKEGAESGDKEGAESGDKEGVESGDKEGAESCSGSHSSEEEMKGFGAGHSSGDAHEESEESEGGTIVVLTWRSKGLSIPNVG
jgi:hypothetical protein